MSITVERKSALIKEYGTKEGDTGSPEVQIAILTERIADQLVAIIADQIAAQIDLAPEAAAKRPAADELPLDSIEI